MGGQEPNLFSFGRQNRLYCIKEYVNKIGNQISVEKAFLFGSYARGTYTPDSDVDLAIFSSYFETSSVGRPLPAADLSIGFEPFLPGR